MRARQRLAPRLSDERLTLQAKTTTRDAAGQDIESWETVASVWAADWVPDMRGHERFLARQMIATAQRTFRIRYRDDVTPTHRLLDEAGRAWNITDVRPIGRRRWLDLDVTARAEGA